jgi:hypothetical protein
MAKDSNTLNKVIKDFNSSWDYCAGSWHQRWNDNYYLYNNNRVKVGYNGITDTFVPMTFSTIETMTSALFGSKPRFMYTPPAAKQDQKTDILNELVDFYWEKDKWSIKVINWGRDMLRYGTSVVYMHWDRNMPCMINVPIRDFFIDPTANSLETAAFMGRRYLTTKSELESFEIVDLEKSNDMEIVMKPKYQNIDKITSKGNDGGENTDKQEKDMWYGSTVGEDANLVEVIEYWTKDRVISVANRSVVIEDSENYYKSKAKMNGDKYASGLMPFAVLRDYVDGSLFYAKSEIDFIADQQELLNDLTNQNIDSITFTLNQMYTLDPRYAHLLEEIENMPGAIYPVEAGALQPIVQRPVPQDAFAERLNIKNEIRETTASNEIVKGVGMKGTQTATEIQAQIAGAGQRLALKITQIENEGFFQLGTIVLQMIKLYVTEPMLVRVVGRDGVNWELFDPTEFKGDYEVQVQLETTVNSQKTQQANQAKEMYAAFVNDPEVNQTELKKLVLQRGFDLDPDEVQMLMAPPEQQQGSMGQMMPQDMMAQPGGQPQGPQGQLSPQGQLPQGPTGTPDLAQISQSLGGLSPEEEALIQQAISTQQ